MNTFKTMKSGVLLMLLLCAGALCADAPPAAPPPAPNPAVDPILDALDQRGKSLKEFTADVTMSTTDTSVGNTNTRLGHVLFQKKGDSGDARMHVTFDSQVKKNGTKPMLMKYKLEYILNDGVLLDYDFEKKLGTRRQVAQPGQKVNLLKLGEGPFPLPIGQSKQDVHRNFIVSKIAPAPDDPPSSTHLQLKPIRGTSMARHFSKIDIWVDPKSNMPVRIDTLDATGSEERTTQFSNVQVNPQKGLTDADFLPPKIDEKTWNLHDEALKQ